MLLWNQPEMLWNKHAETGRGGAFSLNEQAKADLQDGLLTGKIGHAINMLVSRTFIG
jgi:hypothetical protein